MDQGDLGLVFVVPWAQPSVRSKRHLDRFIRFRRVHGRD